MRVQDIMTVSPEVCRPDDNLARAVSQMWGVDCGVLPVVDGTGRLAGIVTDRDIAIALGTRNKRASEVSVRSVMRTAVETCSPAEGVITALSRMAERQVRRLPVVDEEHRLLGIVSLSDAALAAGSGLQAVRPGAVLDTFRSVCARPLPVPVAAATD
jgi:CBS domain-containing protein